MSTVSHPDRDLVSVRIESGLLETGALRVIFKFPYSDGGTANLSGNWNAPKRRSTSVEKSGEGFALLSRELDGTRYFAAVKFSNGAKFSPTGNPYEFELRANSGELEFSCEFSPEKIDPASVPGFGESRKAYEKMWSGFRENGAFVYLSGSSDIRWEKLNYEHPALIGTFGMLRGDGTDPSAIRRTLNKIDAAWNFDKVWGWDFPMLAMAALRSGDPERAIGYLLFSTPHYSWDDAGTVNSPCAYLPANGGLLAAAAMLANGWDGAPQPDPDALLFPKNGKWKARAEGFGQKHQ